MLICIIYMKIIHLGNNLTSTWYNKPTDTGLIMNYHALAPKRYKRSVVSGFVHRIYRACSTWENFHDCLTKAKKLLERNQYPPEFYDPIIKDSLNKILGENIEKDQTNTSSDKKKSQNYIMLVQYRGKCTEDYARALHKIGAPCNIVMTLRKLKTVLPSLKPSVEMMLRSGVVYQITCPRCQACYVGQTCRHLHSRFREHVKNQGPLKNHMKNCNTNISEENVKILSSTSKGEAHLLTLEALYIQEIKPSINTKDEYRRRTLTIKL